MKGEALVYISLVVVIWIQNLQVCRSHHATCDRTYSKYDCVDTYQNHKRIYNQLIITDRDSKSSKSSGIPTDWFHWEEYLQGLVCRCSEELNRISEGNLTIYNQFTIENYGECWSSRLGQDNLHTLTRSNNCIGAGYLYCQSESMSECTGTKRASFLYQIQNRTKLLDEHCHIVKRIVCPSSTMLPNSSSPSQFLGNFTALISSTSTWQNGSSSMVPRKSKVSVDSTSRSEYTSPKVLKSSTAVIGNITGTGHYTVSREVLQNSTFLVESTKTLQHTNSRFFQNSTVPIGASNAWHSTYSQSYLASLRIQITDSQLTSISVNASWQKSTSMKFLNRTDSMLSQAQSLNTGMLYTSGSKLPNVTLAPTQLFFTTSKCSTTAATIFSWTVEVINSTKHQFYNTSSLNQAKSSETSFSTPSTAEKLRKNSYHSASSATNIHTSKLLFALSSINTSPIEATSIQTLGSKLDQNLSTSGIPSAIPTATVPQYLSTISISIHNSTTSRSFRDHRSTLSNDLSKIRNNTTSSTVIDLQLALSKNPSNMMQNTIVQPSYPNSSLQQSSDASIKHFFSKSYEESRTTEIMKEKHSSTKQREASATSPQSPHVNIVETSAAHEPSLTPMSEFERSSSHLNNDSIFAIDSTTLLESQTPTFRVPLSTNEPSLTPTSEFEKSYSHLNNGSIYSTTLLESQTPAFHAPQSSPLEGTRSTLSTQRYISSQQLEVSYELSRKSHVTVAMHSSRLRNDTGQTSTTLSPISSDSMTTSKTSSDNSPSLNNFSSPNSNAEKSSSIPASTQTASICVDCKGNSADITFSNAFIIFIAQFMLMLFD